MKWRQQMARDRVLGTLSAVASVAAEEKGDGYVVLGIANRKRDFFYDDKAPSDLDRELRSLVTENWLEWVGQEPPINATKYVFRYKKTGTPFVLEVVRGHESGA